jgi:hypothetical protein
MCLLWSTNWSFISQKTAFFIVTAVKATNHACGLLLWRCAVGDCAEALWALCAIRESLQDVCTHSTSYCLTLRYKKQFRGHSCLTRANTDTLPGFWRWVLGNLTVLKRSRGNPPFLQKTSLKERSFFLVGTFSFSCKRFRFDEVAWNVTSREKQFKKYSLRSSR